ncbi:histidine kinase CKI1-like [Senna tora]|uniref:Histidine kinase CKI1-like n=1 Tax=Senna tora TaxID=362788 RepID=A0A834W5F5_9FABA|nr:histidine kinase CKI1-like [Senna tora]
MTSIASKPRSWFMKYLLSKENIEDSKEVVNAINCMNSVFEVEGTAKGIPKEPHKSVFEEYT